MLWDLFSEYACVIHWIIYGEDEYHKSEDELVVATSISYCYYTGTTYLIYQTWISEGPYAPPKVW